MSKVIGIDLGTTNSCVSVHNGTEAIVIPNSEGSRTTPSVVAYNEEGERLVGQVARRQALTNPVNTIYVVKRLVGRKFDAPEVARSLNLVPFKIVRAPNGDAWVAVRNKQLSPAEINAAILSRMKSIAEEYLGEEVTQAIITCPAYFDDAQRQATKDAGRIAGLEVLRIINEPTAAALAYGLGRDTSAEREESERIAVYDLGGGTFDITILELTAGVFEVKATNGDTFLGGEDFDQRIIDYIAKRFEEQTGIDLKKDSMALQRLKEASERAKHELSSSMETEINLPFIAANESGPCHLVETLTRGQFEELVRDLVERTGGPCKIALDDAGVQVKDLSEVILVGGMTRMPLVQSFVKKLFGRQPHQGVNPDEVVAVGAGIQGAVLQGDVQDVLLLDVTPLSLGVETAGGVFSRIIEKNTTIPCKRSQVFSTAADNQPLVSVHVLQGERGMAADNKTLARFELVGIPPAPRGVPEIEVTFDLDANGIVHVSAKDLGTGKEQQIRIVASSGLTEEEVQRIISEAKQSSGEDKQRRELAEARNTAEAIIYSTERSLAEYEEKLKPNDVAAIKRDLAALKALLVIEDAAKIRSACTALENSAIRIAEVLYGKELKAK